MARSVATAKRVRQRTADVESGQQETRARLLQAAGEVFAEHGFAGAKIREICQRAGANVAAVNYHFRDKDELYLAVFREASCMAGLGHIAELGKAPLGPREKLGMFVHGFLLNLLMPGLPWQGRLMAREMVDPTMALDQVVKDVIRPVFTVLRQIVAELLGASVESDAVRDAGASVIGQCLFYKHSEPVIRRMYPNLVWDEKAVAHVAAHVTAFSLAGLDAMAGSKHNGAKRTGGHV